ncbi:hypothetical protein [Leptospira kirschneri]|uniref:hypothetical protein n=1 Tax=Leptospira kirschneri TaxID=29507 RepID=UPI0002DBA30A|nr:hypothetical protein [Leptospira kirschneri]EPG48930.1 hypothetical protein LEP1GSC049_1627 [Leptospira kirschneri serovar Cynopteri str. 3522 CT]
MIFIRLYWIGKEFYTLPLVSATLETGSELQGKSSRDLWKFLKSLFLGSVYVAGRNRSNKIKSATETYFNLEIVYSRTGNKKWAIENYQRFIEATPTKYEKSEQDVRAKIEELKKILLIGKNIELESDPGSVFFVRHFHKAETFGLPGRITVPTKFKSIGNFSESLPTHSQINNEF